jgi:hypothetical protein
MMLLLLIIMIILGLLMGIIMSQWQWWRRMLRRSARSRQKSDMDFGRGRGRKGSLTGGERGSTGDIRWEGMWSLKPGGNSLVHRARLMSSRAGSVRVSDKSSRFWHLRFCLLPLCA